ncbi:MAG TPA: DUF4332 domain-containing protein [Anaerolineales bacterium]|nr:DUF4332 domain-containing protein [Anaerolineales bacterium]
MDWWLILLIIIVVILLVWWLLSRQTTGDEAAHADQHQEAAAEAAPAAEDLTKIEGVGPKVQGLLYEAGIKTYAQLAAKTPEELDTIMDAAGSIYRAMDETSWPKQAALAAAGDWEALQKLQDELVGGK